MSNKEPKLGSGKRFENLKNKLKGKVDNPSAVAASVGIKKFGKEKMEKMAQKGKNRKK